MAGDFWAKFQCYRAIFGTGFGWFTSILDQFNSNIWVKYFLFRHVMLQMRLKYPPLLLKQAWNEVWASDLQSCDILDISPMRGCQGAPHTPEMKFLIWLSSGPDQYKFILWHKLSFLWKFQQDWSNLRGGFDWSGHFMTSSPPTLPGLYFGLDMHFWRNTPLKFIQVATPAGHNMVYSLKSA